LFLSKLHRLDIVISPTPLRSEEGEIIAGIEVINDITERKIYEQKLSSGLSPYPITGFQIIFCSLTDFCELCIEPGGFLLWTTCRTSKARLAIRVGFSNKSGHLGHSANWLVNQRGT